MQDLAQWGWAIALGINMLFGWGLWSARRAFAAKGELQEMERRLTAAEAKLDQAPTAKAMHELALAISGMGGDLKATVAELKGLRGVVHRLDQVVQRQEDYLLKSAGERPRGG